MAAPPVPPRPRSSQGYSVSYLNPPPVPPVPPQLKYDLAPHFTDPIPAPQPHRIDPSLPANMAQHLEDYAGINHAPGFAMPQQPHRNPSLPPTPGAEWSPWAGSTLSRTPQPQQFSASTPNSFPSLNTSLQQFPNSFSSPAPESAPQVAPQSAAPSLTISLPSVATLQTAFSNVQNPNHDPALKIAWARDVVALVDRTINPSLSTDPPVGPAIIKDPVLLRLSQLAVTTILQIAASGAQPVPPHVAEAIYLRATFAASGAYPEHVQHNPRIAFRDFESAARGGHAIAWFRLGRDYENFNDISHARECFERGVKLGVESCAYRMGMAHLMGQLGLQPNLSTAIPLLHRAATLATPATPQPAYIFALVLLGEFTSLSSPVPPSALAPFIPAGSTQVLEARKHLERAAYLGFSPAQYKLGHAYEFAQPPFPFDPLMSVQYYSLASQQGEVEADMALSKWFLCGSGSGEEDEAGFEKDEALAFTFAEKAARKGLPSAEFAMGYYAEVGVGSPKDLQAAIQWYQQAREHGNKDAADRLVALSQPSPNALSRQQHDTITENKLVRKRTQAKQRSDSLRQNASQNQLPLSSPPQQAYPAQPGPLGQNPNNTFPGQPRPQQVKRPDGGRFIENIRNSSLGSPGPGPGYPSPQQTSAPQLTPAQQYQQQYQQQSRLSQHQPSPPLLQQPLQQPGGWHPVHSQTLPPNSRPGSGLGVETRPHSSGPGVGRGVPSNTHRYTLTDAPMSLGQKSPGPAGGRNSPARRVAGGRVPSSTLEGPTPPTQGPAVDNNANNVEEDHDEPLTPPGVTVGLGGGQVFAPKPSKGPATFAEMGFQGAKAEDKDCCIM